MRQRHPHNWSDHFVATRPATGLPPGATPYQPVNDLLAAIGFLTTIPVPARAQRAPLSRMASWFPIAGLVVAAPVVAVLWLPLEAQVRAWLALAAWVAMTGGLHLDGLADTADAAMAAVPRQRRQEILHDVHAGTWAVVALIFVLLGKWILLASPRLPAAAICLAPLLARAFAPLWMAIAPPQPGSQLGQAARPGRAAAMIAASSGVALATTSGLMGILPWSHLLRVVAVTLLTGLSLMLVLHHRLGGFGGDATGATIECCELAALAALTLLG